jgi:hypothetical protein
MLGPLPLCPVLAVTQKAPPFVLLVGNFEPFFPPEPVHPLFVDLETFPPQQHPHSPVAVAGVLSRKRDHTLGQGAIPLFFVARVALRRSGLADRSAGPALGDLQLSPHVRDGGSPPSRAQKFPLLTSFRMLMSTACSATIFFRRAFSFSSSLRRLVSLGFIPP